MAASPAFSQGFGRTRHRLAYRMAYVEFVVAQRGHNAPAERGAAPPLGSNLNNLRKLTPEEQEKKLEQDPKFQALPPARQKEILNSLKWFNSLTPEQQNRVLTRMAHLGELTPAQRVGLEGIYEHWQTMTPDRRQAFHAAYNNLSQLAPEQREKRMDSPQFQARFSPEEQRMIRQALDLNLPPDVVGSPPPSGGR